ncbi:MAG: glycoside hydrolase family 26 protein [Rubripirellula sp.]
MTDQRTRGANGNNHRMPSVVFMLIAALLPLSASPVPAADTAERSHVVPADRDATSETVGLLRRLHDQSGKGVLFGHQDTAAYGVGWSRDSDRSDIKDVCGNWPVVFGWDLGDIHRTHNLDGVRFDDMKRWIVEADARGGINTLSLHLDNPVTGRNAFDKTTAVRHILPAGSAHAAFLATLDHVADFLSELKRSDGELVPVVLRPFHEHNQTWPWWGVEACSEEEFITLWRMTVDYLGKTRGMHHALYAYSPQDVSTEPEYMRGYPGDDYVDVFGLDYYRAWHWRQVPRFGQTLSMVNRLAESHGKVAALTETGVDKVPNADWWSEYLLKALDHDDWSRKTVWSLVWRNKSRGHHFGPFRGHPSAPDFLKFQADPLTVFGSDE